MGKMSKLLVVLASVGVLGVVWLAGCGNNTDETTATTSAQASQAAQTASTLSRGDNVAGRRRTDQGLGARTSTSDNHPERKSSFTVVMSQDGNTITGPITISGGCISEGTISGTLSGQTIEFGVIEAAGVEFHRDRVRRLDERDIQDRPTVRPRQRHRHLAGNPLATLGFCNSRSSAAPDCPLSSVMRRLVGLAWLPVGSRDRRATPGPGAAAGQPRTDATA